MFSKSIFYLWFLCFLVTAELGGILQMPWLAWVPALGKQTFFILIRCKFFFAELGKTSIFLREIYLKGWQILPIDIQFIIFKGSVREKWKGYRLNAIKKSVWSLLILLLSVASIRKKLIKTSYTEERSAHTIWGSWNIRLWP